MLLHVYADLFHFLLQDISASTQNVNFYTNELFCWLDRGTIFIVYDNNQLFHDDAIYIGPYRNVFICLSDSILRYKNDTNGQN